MLKRRGLWSGSGYGSLAGVTLFGLAVTLLLFVTELEQAGDAAQQELDRLVVTRMAGVRAGLASAEAMVAATGGFFDASNEVLREEFERYAATFIGRQPGLQALGWLPRVRHAERERFEEGARAMGLAAFRITDADQDEIAPAGMREDYFPVLYLAPAAGNERALGYDVGGEAVRRLAIEAARDTGLVSASARITLVQPVGDRFAVLLIRPVYAGGNVPPTVEARRSALAGFVVGAFLLAELVGSALDELAPSGLDFSLYDVSGSEDPRLLYARVGDAPGAHESDGEGRLQAWWSQGLERQVELEVAGRTWKGIFTPTATFWSRQRAEGPWRVLAGGLAVTLTALAGLVANLRQRRALVESEARYRLLSEEAHDWITWRGPDGRFLYVSPACEIITGHPPEDFLADPGLVTELIHPDDRPTWLYYLQAGLDAPPHEGDYRVVAADGEVRWVLHRCRPLFDAEGHCLGRLAVKRDITARKNAEEALRSSEQRLLTAQSCAGLGLWECEPSSGLLEWSPECAALFGVDAAGIRSVEDWFARVHPEDLPRLRVQWGALAASGQAFELEYRLRDDSPTPRWIVTKGGARAAAPGRRERISGVSFDATSRKADELLLRKLSRVVEQSAEAIVITDLAARVEYVNEAFVTGSGYAREELLGRNLRLLKSGRTPVATFEALWSTLLSGEVWRGQFINRRKDGGEYVQTSIVMPLADSSGRTTHYAAIQMDITAERRLQEGLERQRELLEQTVSGRTRELERARAMAEAAVRATGELVQRVDRALAGPLAGLTRALAPDAHLANGGPATQVEAHARAQALALRLEDVLDLVRLESDLLELASLPFRLDELVDAVTADVAPQATARGVALDVHRPSGVAIRGDEPRLRRVLSNLLRQVLDGTPTGGSVRLDLHCVPEGAAVIRLHLQLAGSGGCAAASELRSVSRWPNGTAPGDEAARIALQVARRLVVAMGGAVEVECPTEGGCCIRANVPLGPAALQPDIAAAAAPARPLAGLRLLLVDDDPMSREVVAEMLERAGCVVATADEGRRALARLAEEDFDAVLMELRMPGMDGAAATRALRAAPRAAGVPVIGLSVHASRAERAEAQRAGMNGFLLKPVDPGAVVDVLRACLRGGGAARAPVSAVGASDTTAPDMDAYAPTAPGPEGAAPPSAEALPSAGLPAAGTERPLAPATDEPPEPAAPTPCCGARPQAAIPEVDGIDTRSGLERVLGDSALYLRLLGQFRDAEADFGQRFLRATEAADPAEPGRLAHGLKGVAANLGMQDVALAAAALETVAAVPGSARDAALSRIERALAEVLAGIAEVLGQAGEAGGAGAGSSGEGARDLSALLAERDPDGGQA